MPHEINQQISNLLSRGYEVWIFGSRLTGVEDEDSDWDFLVFGDESLLEELSHQEPVPDMDLLVVYDGDKFQEPPTWSSEKVYKHGSLTEWEWQQLDQNSATYMGAKPVNDDSLHISCYRKPAKKIDLNFLEG